jgi:hypothetical protein
MLDQNKTSQELLDQNVISQLIVGDQEYEINAKYWGGLQPSIIDEEIKNLEEKIDNISISATEGSPIVMGDISNSAVLKGGNNKVTNANEVALGKYNESNNDTMFSIGIGTSDSDRKNAFEVKGNGDIYFNDIKFELTPDTDDEVESVWNNILL